MLSADTIRDRSIHASLLEWSDGEERCRGSFARECSICGVRARQRTEDAFSGAVTACAQYAQSCNGGTGRRAFGSKREDVGGKRRTDCCEKISSNKRAQRNRWRWWTVIASYRSEREPRDFGVARTREYLCSQHLSHLLAGGASFHAAARSFVKKMRTQVEFALVVWI